MVARADTSTQKDFVLLLGERGSGKSRYASQMSPDYTVLNIDNRWEEQEAYALGNSHKLRASSVVDAVSVLEKNRPALEKISETLIIDSGTGLFDFETSMDRIKEVEQNKAFRHKADLMRIFAGAVNRWDTSACWIFHYQSSGMNGQNKVRQTITKQELDKLYIFLNVVVEIGIDPTKKMRAAKILWSRYGIDASHKDGHAAGQTIWDWNGGWVGVPQKMHQFIREYKGTEGYTGQEYSLDWLLKFLNKDAVKFSSIEEMVKKLEIKDPPSWFDRAGWGELIKRA